MSRTVEEWIGKKDDTSVPDRVRTRVFDRKDRRCHRCTRRVATGERWTCEHLIALINWRPTAEQPHGNRENNLGVTCCNCLPAKNAKDVAEKSVIYRKKLKHVVGKKRKARPMMGTIDSGWRKRLDGTVVRR